MEIRPATNEDIPAIVNLLKKSLGEDLMPKSEAYWRWKHVDNPFGPSRVLLAIENNEIIGVRAFMQWRWISDDKTYRAVRAVDTATHPQHQGKGIFKKLTLQLVDECKKEGFDFIFNTPNDQSRPGYLKMGWEPAAKLPIVFKIRKPVAIISQLLNRSSGPSDSPSFEVSDDYSLTHLLSSHNGRIHTDWSMRYFNWRYQQVPVATYGAVSLENGAGLLFYRIKPTRFGEELRICDIFADSKKSYSELLKRLSHTRRDADYYTLSGLQSINMGWPLKLKVGPLVTVRNLNMQSLSSLKDYNQWSPSLGDLELF